MASMEILLDEEAVNRFVTEYALEYGFAPIRTAMMQLDASLSGQPLIMLGIEVDGKMILAKTSLPLMEAACRAMRARSGIDQDGNPLG